MYIGKHFNSASMALNRHTTANLNLKSSKTTMSGRGVGFDDMLSKTKPKMSDDEFKQAMVEQAQKDAANGVCGGNEYKSLTRAYMSVVSPDRKGIIGNLFNSTFKNGLPSFVNITHPSGSPLSGSVIASYSSSRGWEAIGTNEEFARSSEIGRVYFEAWKQARNGTGGDNVQTDDREYVDNTSTYNKIV